MRQEQTKKGSAMTDDKTPNGKSLVLRASEGLVEMGLIEDSGKRRDGQILCRLTPLVLSMSEAKRTEFINKWRRK
jgi:hypothetical protein